MPMICLGTWKSQKGAVANAVKIAVQAGYRGIDCANDYGNEPEIGQALKELFDSGVVKREDLFIQAKLWNTNHRPEHVRPDLEATLKDLQISYVDSFVIHWPQASPAAGQLALGKDGNYNGPISENTMFPVNEENRYACDLESHYTDTWTAMEALVDAGLTRSIGLSNFNIPQIREILSVAKKHKPAILQNECHPYLQLKDIRDFCNAHGIQLQAYSPLGSGDRPVKRADDPELLSDPKMATIAKKYKKSIPQIVLRWHIQRGVGACPKSVTPERIKENFDLWDFELSPEDMAEFDRFNVGYRFLVWAETAGHPDYPFKEELPWDFKVPHAPKHTDRK